MYVCVYAVYMQSICSVYAVYMPCVCVGKHEREGVRRTCVQVYKCTDYSVKSDICQCTRV